MEHLSEANNHPEKLPRLYRLLGSCNGYELRRFRVFLESPFFNQRGELLSALDAIRESLPAPCDPERLYAATWPGEPYGYARYRHLLSDLCALLETFWQVQALLHDPQQQDLLLLRTLAARRLDHDLAARALQAQERLQAQPLRGAAYLRHRGDLALLLHDHAVRTDNRSTQSGLHSAVHALDAEYIAHKLRLAAAAINRTNVLGEGHALPLLPAVTAFVDSLPADALGSPLIPLFRLIIRTLQPQPDHVAYHALLAHLHEHASALDPETVDEAYAFALNYCIRMVNLAEPGWDEALRSLYEILLDGGHLRTEGHLPAQHFKNYVTLGLRLGHADAIDRRLPALGLQLPPGIRVAAMHYAEAAVAFARGQHGQALRLLQQVEWIDVYFQLDAKSLLLKVWYEREEMEPLLSLIESFKMQLRRSRKIGDYQRRTYGNQLRIVQMLVRHRMGSRKPVAEIRTALESLRPIADLQWLERQVSEIARDA